MTDGDRDSVIEETAAALQRWYPDNVSTNAFCAAVRSMKSDEAKRKAKLGVDSP